MNIKPTLVRLPRVLATIGLSRSTLYNRIKEGTFPAPITIGPRSVAWIAEEVEAWIKGRIADSRMQQT